MFKYVKFEKVETEHTVLEFRGMSEEVKVNHFSSANSLSYAVSIESEIESAINELVNAQDEAINCVFITQNDFKELVGESLQLKRIREVVATEIAKRYSLADEIAMSKRDTTDEKRVAYESYVAECLAIGYGLKAEIGY